MSQKSPTIGIDLGTTYCCVGYLNSNNNVDIIDNEHGDRTTPSYVAFTEEGEIIGKLAKDTVFRKPENVIYDSKRLIGRNFHDKYLQQNFKMWPFKIIPSEKGTPLIQILRKGKPCSYKPHEISAKLLTHMKKIAQKRLGREVNDAVITVPAHFNHHQRTATTEAGKLAGLNVLRIINEPTAAALAYVHKNEVSDCKNLLVFDLGGGTFDVSVVTIQEKSVIVRATCGNAYLGGRDFDNNLTNFIVTDIQDRYKLDVRDKKITMQRIKAQSESLKVKLSFQTVAFFDLPSLDGEDIDLEISRKDFEKINLHLFECCIQTVNNCLKNSGVSKEGIEKVLLVGGSTRIPKLQELLSDFFGKKKKLVSTINPDEAVAYGAAVQASLCNKEGDRTTDVSPLSLGTNISGGEMNVIIPRNTQIPVTKTVRYLTSINKQTDIAFNIYEGERRLAKYNTKIGKCTIKIPSEPVGYPVEILFRVDANGILEVEAKTGNGIYRKLTIEYEQHTVQEVNEILQDALENKQSDNRKATLIKQWRKLQEYCENVNAISIYKDKDISERDRNAITPIAEEISDWLWKNEVVDGSKDEEKVLLRKQHEIEKICEPIMAKYGYNVKDMDCKEFYEFITKQSP